MKYVQAHLLSQLARIVLDMRGDLGASVEKEVEDLVVETVAELKHGELGKKVASFIEKAMELARIVVLERAAYTVQMPHGLDEGEFQKQEEDQFMTNVGVLVGIDGGDNDDEQSGAVAFVSSPMLVKWGTGAGRMLDQYSVLVKACVGMSSQRDFTGNGHGGLHHRDFDFTH